MERDLIDGKDSIFSQHDDNFAQVKQDFAKIYYDNNLDALTNANDLGFIDINKMTAKPLFHENGDTQGLSELDNPFSKINVKEEQSPFHHRTALNASSPNIFLNRNLQYSSHFAHNSQNNNMKYNFYPEAFEMTPIKKPFPDEYSANFDNQFGENSNPPNFPESNTHTQSEAVESFFDNPMVRVWGFDSSKAKKKVNPSNDFFKSRQLKFGPGYFNPTFDHYEEEPHDFVPKEFKRFDKASQESNKDLAIKQEPEKNIEDLSAIRVKIESFKDQKTPNKKRSEDFKTTCRSTPASRETATHQAEEEEEDNENENDNENDDGFPDTKHRSSRGLRVLSVKVKDIVNEKQNTSYKEVADCLIAEFNMKFKQKKPGEAKDEQNVKRRVYDALNVLIAADILKKDGKVVYCDQNLANIGPPKKKKLKEERDKLMQKIREVKRKNKHKSEKIQELVSKCLAVKNLVKRNKENIILDEQIGNENQFVNTVKIKEEKINIENKENITETPKGRKGKKSEDKSSVKKATKKGKAKEMEEEKQPNTESETSQEKSLTKIRKEEIIRFPFIALVNSSADNAMNLNMKSTQRQLFIESKNPLNVYGDIDILIKMGMNRVPKGFFESNIPPEVQKYLNKNYLESLL